MDSADTNVNEDQLEQSNEEEESVASPIAGRDEENDNGYFDFLATFVRAKGAIHLVMIACFLSVGIGSTVGVIPNLMADRYARLRHNYTDVADCSDFDRLQKPAACQYGADDAQQAAAISTLVTNLLTLGLNSVLGGLSDAYGRRSILILSVFLSLLSPLVLVFMQRIPAMDPAWFYAAYAAVGIVNYISVCFASLSDVIPPKYRTPGFGLFLGSFFLFFSLAPSLTQFVSHYHASAFSCVMIVLCLVYTIVALPETLPKNVAARNQSLRQEASRSPLQLALRPILSLGILNRNLDLRLVAIGSFLSGMVYSSDATLVLYYMEDELNVRDSDLASMFLWMGLAGVLMQSVLLKFMIHVLGEQRLLVITFISGTIHNLCYGLATTQFLLYVALSLSQLTKVNFPILSSLAAAHVSQHEQGQIQGALFALSALANAVGPISLQYVYHLTKSTRPGFMFVVAACLYFCGTICVSFIASSKEDEGPTLAEITTSTNGGGDDLGEPLLAGHEDDDHDDV